MAVIFISRGTVSGVRILIDGLRESTGVKCLSREDLIKEVSRYGDWVTEALTQLSKATFSYNNFIRMRRPYVVLMRQALLEKIREDNIIYYGFSGHLLVPRLKHFVRVRINAPLNLRVTMTMERLKCSEEAAREYISNSDDIQIRWARFVYGVDISNPALYDLNVNLGHLAPNTVCGILERFLSEDDFKASHEIKTQVEQTLMAANVEAALVIDPRTRDLEIDARVENRCMCLTGPYLENNNLVVVMEIAQKVEGVERVEYNPGYISQYRLEEHDRSFNLTYHQRDQMAAQQGARKNPG